MMRKKHSPKKPLQTRFLIANYESVVFVWSNNNFSYLIDFIISMITLAEFFKQQIEQEQHSVVNIKDLEEEFQIPSSCLHEDRTQSSIKQPEDLKIVSPFYARIDQHPKNCKCIYHKRKWPEIKKIKRHQTQPNDLNRRSLPSPVK